MPWLTFDRDFNWSPGHFHGWLSMSFKAGDTLLVTREAAAAAQSASKARPATDREIDDARRRRAQ